jgi:N-acetylneuraminate synthase
MSAKVFVIAEAGVNHNGSTKLALDLVDAAAAAGADAIKFQTFKAKDLVTTVAPKAEYTQKTTDQSETQFEMIRKLELDEDAHDQIVSRCKSKGIEFMSTPFDVASLDFLCGHYDPFRLKIPSGEITNPLLLLAAARSGKPVILSTGMSTLGEIEEALNVLACGYTNENISGPGIARDAYTSSNKIRALEENVTLLHCTTEYPAPFRDVNLRAMETIRSAFGLSTGYSDHTRGIAVALAAVALGASVIEKHFTLDRGLEGPDHAASIEPHILTNLVEGIREIELSMGRSTKSVSSSESKNRAVVRKSLVANGVIRTGDQFTTENLVVKRPGSGISAMKYWDYLGTTAKRDFHPEELID